MKKVFSIIGIFIGLAFIAIGIFTIKGGLGGSTNDPSPAPSYYDSGYATFGTDYYTYSVNNAAEAASGALRAAYNIDEIADFILLFFGHMSMLFGLMVICGFGVVLCSSTKKNSPKLDNAPMYYSSDAQAIETESLE